MRAIVTVDMENAAFDDGNAGTELARILRFAADQTDFAPRPDVGAIPLRDVNGNRVGELRIIDDAAPKVRGPYDASGGAAGRDNY